MTLLVPEPPLLDRVGILVGDKRFEEWTDYSVTADIFTPANTFSMRCGPVAKDVLETILPGRSVNIYFGDGSEDNEHIVLTGWIEEFNDTVSKSTVATDIAGRDMASDLLETTVPQSLAIKNRNFYDIAQDVCDVVGLNVIVANDANRLLISDKKKWKKSMAQYGLSVAMYNTKYVNALKWTDSSGGMYYTPAQAKAHLAKFGFKPPLMPPWIPGVFKTMAEVEPKDGQHCWDFLADKAGELDVWMWMTANGMLVIQRPRYDQDPLYLFVTSESVPEINNVISRSYKLSIAGVPTSYTNVGRVKTKGGKKERVEVTYDSTRIIPSSDDAFLVGISSQQESDYIRVASSFYRPRWSTDEQSKNAEELGKRSWYELKAAEMGIFSIEVVVRGHDQGGILYTPDTVCRLVDERLGLDSLYYIAACEYTMGVKSPDSAGKKTRLTLTPLYMWSPLS